MDILTHTLYLIGAASFVLGLHLMNSPASARRGNQLSAAGMIVAVATTVLVLVQGPALSWIAVVVLVLGLLVGGGAGFVTAQRVKMTAMPQLVSIFNAVGGGAAALIAIYTAIEIAGAASVTESSGVTDLSIGLDLLIGGVTFSGSLIAGGKLAGKVSGAPIVVPAGQLINLVLAVVAVASGIAYIAGFGGVPILILLSACALALGVLSTLPIGGADMPVVISLLNAFTGTAVAMAGFVINSTPLIIAGALVGAAGGILTKLMADAMNRSLVSIIAGGFGTADSLTAGPMDAGSGTVREITVDDAWTGRDRDHRSSYSRRPACCLAPTLGSVVLRWWVSQVRWYPNGRIRRTRCARSHPSRTLLLKCTAAAAFDPLNTAFRAEVDQDIGITHGNPVLRRAGHLPRRQGRPVLGPRNE